MCFAHSADCCNLSFERGPIISVGNFGPYLLDFVDQHRTRGGVRPIGMIEAEGGRKGRDRFAESGEVVSGVTRGVAANVAAAPV